MEGGLRGNPKVMCEIGSSGEGGSSLSSSSLKGEFSLDYDDDGIDDGHGTKLVVQTWLKTYNITLMAQ